MNPKPAMTSLSISSKTKWLAQPSRYKQKEIWDDTEHKEVMTHGNVSRSFFSRVGVGKVLWLHTRLAYLCSVVVRRRYTCGPPDKTLHHRSVWLLIVDITSSQCEALDTQSLGPFLSPGKSWIGHFYGRSVGRALFRRITILRLNLHNKKLRQRLWAGGCWPRIIRLI